MAGQPLKKKEVKTASLSDFKAKMGLTPSKESSNADKVMEWLDMPQAYKEALKLPGIPQGYVTTIVGHSNTGKSTLVNHAVVAAQKQGLIPVIYDTENNFDFKYAIDMGMEAEPIYGDVEVEVVDSETGEVKKKMEKELLLMMVTSSILTMQCLQNVTENVIMQQERKFQKAELLLLLRILHIALMNLLMHKIMVIYHLD